MTNKLFELRRDFFEEYLSIFKEFKKIPYLSICSVWVCDYGDVLDLEEDDEMEFVKMFTECGHRYFCKNEELTLPIFSIDYSFKFEEDCNYEEELHDEVVDYLSEDLYETTRHSEFYRHEFWGINDMLKFLHLLQGMRKFTQEGTRDELIHRITNLFKNGYDVPSNFFVEAIREHILYENEIGQVGLSGDCEENLYLSVFFGGKYDPSWSVDVSFDDIDTESLKLIYKALRPTKDLIADEIKSMTNGVVLD